MMERKHITQWGICWCNPEIETINDYKIIIHNYEKNTIKNNEVNFWYWLSDKLPKKLVYFSFLQVMAHSTTGQYGNTVVPELSGLDAIERYNNDFDIV